MKEEFQEGDSKGCITFNADPGRWFLRLKWDGTIEFNREGYPDAMPDDFAKAFLTCLATQYKQDFERALREMVKVCWDKFSMADDMRDWDELLPDEQYLCMAECFEAFRQAIK